MPSSDRDLQAACLDWLDNRIHPERAMAATLTFRPFIEGHFLTELDAKGAVRHFLRRMDAAAYGKRASRHGAVIGAIPIREGGVGLGHKHLHYHLQLEVPAHEALERWLGVAEREWLRIRWASPEQNVFRAVTDSGWLSYMLKLRDKPDFMDAVDVELMRLN